MYGIIRQLRIHTTCWSYPTWKKIFPFSIGREARHDPQTHWGKLSTKRNNTFKLVTAILDKLTHFLRYCDNGSSQSLSKYRWKCINSLWLQWPFEGVVIIGWEFSSEIFDQICECIMETFGGSYWAVSQTIS